MSCLKVGHGTNIETSDNYIKKIFQNIHFLDKAIPGSWWSEGRKVSQKGVGSSVRRNVPGYLTIFFVRANVMITKIWRESEK